METTFDQVNNDISSKSFGFIDTRKPASRVFIAGHTFSAEGEDDLSSNESIKEAENLTEGSINEMTNVQIDESSARKTPAADGTIIPSEEAQKMARSVKELLTFGKLWSRPVRDRRRATAGQILKELEAFGYTYSNGTAVPTSQYVSDGVSAGSQIGQVGVFDYGNSGSGGKTQDLGGGAFSQSGQTGTVDYGGGNKVGDVPKETPPANTGNSSQGQSTTPPANTDKPFDWGTVDAALMTFVNNIKNNPRWDKEVKDFAATQTAPFAWENAIINSAKKWQAQKDYAILVAKAEEIRNSPDWYKQVVDGAKSKGISTDINMIESAAYALSQPVNKDTGSAAKDTGSASKDTGTGTQGGSSQGGSALSFTGTDILGSMSFSTKVLIGLGIVGLAVYGAYKKGWILNKK